MMKTVSEYRLMQQHKGISKTQHYPSLLARKTPDSFGEKGRDEANKKSCF